MSTERPDFKAMTDIADLSTAYAALMEEARLKNISADVEEFSTVEAGISACERLTKRLEGASKDEDHSSEELSTAEEADMASKTKKKSKTREKTNGGGPRHGSKTESIAKMLGRASGCTAQDIKELTGWPAVSMPAMAKACGLKLRKEKEKGKPTRYYGE